MERQTTVFLSILSIAAIILLIFFLAIYFLPGSFNVEINKLNIEVNELKEKVATLQKEATLGVERADKEYKDLLETAVIQESSFTATRQALIDEIEHISQTTKSIAANATAVSKDATVMVDTIDLLAATATAQTPMTVLLKEGASVDLFNQELNITLDGYSSLISSDITFTVRGLESARQTFEDIGLGETVFYPGKNKFVIVVNDVQEQEDVLIAELIIFMR